MIFSYDESGAPIAIHYRLNGSAEDVFYTYYLEKNLQGDIIALYNSSGAKLVGYTYDAWGNCTTTYYNNGGSTGAQFNPFRYRGYYYDSDLGLYYLNSRYYDAKTGRFLNADGQINNSLLGYNQYIYCENNPIVYADYTGESPLLIIAGVLILAVVLSGCELQERDPPKRAGAYDTFDEALEAGLNDVYNCTQSSKAEHAGYVFKEGKYYYYKSGRDEFISMGPDAVYYPIEIREGQTLLAIFHSHTRHKEDIEAVPSEPDFLHMKSYKVDAYIVDVEGTIYMLPHDADYRTQAQYITHIKIAN